MLEKLDFPDKQKFENEQEYFDFYLNQAKQIDFGCIK